MLIRKHLQLSQLRQRLLSERDNYFGRTRDHPPCAWVCPRVFRVKKGGGERGKRGFVRDVPLV